MAAQGPNDPSPRRRPSRAAALLATFANPLVVVLLAAAVASAFLRDFPGAVLIIAIALIGGSVNAAQAWRSQRAADRLRDTIAPTATVLREGSFQEVRRERVVPGDVVHLGAGDLVPADAELLQARDLHVNEAALTGESMPAAKEAGDRVFLGTSVVSGTALAEVFATGRQTAFGGIAARLAARPPETEFERGLRHFTYLILRVVVVLVGVILVATLSLHRDPLESLLFAVALAVGLTPEFLPMIVSVTLARGAVQMAREQVIVKRLSAIENLGSIDVLCSDKTGTLTTGLMTLHRAADALGGDSPRTLLLASLNSRFETGIRSQLDAAVLARDLPEASAWRKRDEIPFDFERRRLSVVVEKEGEILLVTKGAPESVLSICASCDLSGVRPLAGDLLEQCRKTHEALSALGFRVLAVASKTVADQPAWSREEERDLTLAGFVVFADPPLADAPEAIRSLREDGVAVKILTGDNELVARSVCAQVGLSVEGLLTGDDLDQLGEWALAAAAERTTVFARVSPAQKVRILLALKHRNHVVGFLGDGINDAPSLHAADVGISVPSAADVARDAADMILLQRGLRVLHNGILAGRRASGNVTKYLLMGTSSNFGNMFSMAAAALVLPFLPMLPSQILLNNLLYDLAQVTIPTDNVDPSYLRGPQRWDLRLIRNFMLFIGPVSSVFDLLTFFVLLKVFHAGEVLFHTGWFVESLATQTLVLFVIRTRGNPFSNRPSVALALTTVAIVLAGVALPFSPLAGVLGFAPLPATFFGFLAAVVVTYLLLVEVVKRRLMERAALPART